MKRRAWCLAVAAAIGCGGGAAGTGSGGPTSTSGAGGGGDVAAQAYPDLATLHAAGVARTCSLNGGVCHADRSYPELAKPRDLAALLGAPCGLGAADASAVPNACEVPGDHIVLGGADDEILHVVVYPSDSAAPYPPAKVQLRLAAKPKAYDGKGAVIRRVDAGGKEVLSKPLTGVVVTGIDPATYPNWVELDLSAADVELARWLDPREWTGDGVRQGDANDDGKAHTGTAWAEIVPGDPTRSYFYQRLVDEKLGPVMPLIPRTWSAAATRAVWCWIRGLPSDATADSVDLHAPIAYADCPVDPNAPDPNASGGWPAVHALAGSRCATSACHGATTKAGELDLTPTPAGFQKHVIDQPSKQQPGALYVVPGQPKASYLLCKIDPACESRADKTDVMPLTGTPLSAEEIQTFSDWIVNGAPLE